MVQKVRVGPYTIEVVYDPALKDSGSFGEFRPTVMQIALQPDMAPDLEAETLLHEIDHAIAFAAGLHKGKHSEEDWVERTAPFRLEFLRRNQAALKYLTT